MSKGYFIVPSQFLPVLLLYLGGIFVPVSAQSSEPDLPCYMVTPQGEIENLVYMCGDKQTETAQAEEATESVAVAPASSTSATCAHFSYWDATGAFGLIFFIVLPLPS